MQIVVCDVALGEELACERSYNHMSPEKMADVGKHSITTKEEVAVFNVAQALPLYAVTFVPVDKDGEHLRLLMSLRPLLSSSTTLGYLGFLL